MKTLTTTLILLTAACLSGCAVYGPPPGYAQQPVYQGQQVYAQPAYSAQPVYVQPAPVYVEPPVSFGLNFDFGFGGHRGWHHRGWR